MMGLALYLKVNTQHCLLSHKIGLIRIGKHWLYVKGRFIQKIAFTWIKTEGRRRKYEFCRVEKINLMPILFPCSIAY